MADMAKEYDSTLDQFFFIFISFFWVAGGWGGELSKNNLDVSMYTAKRINSRFLLLLICWCTWYKFCFVSKLSDITVGSAKERLGLCEGAVSAHEHITKITVHLHLRH